MKRTIVERKRRGFGAAVFLTTLITAMTGFVHAQEFKRVPGSLVVPADPILQVSEIVLSAAEQIPLPPPTVGAELNALPPPAAKPELDPATVKQIVNDYLSELEGKRKLDDAQKAKESEAKDHEVGSDLNMKARWVEGVGLTFFTAQEDWKFHFGGRFQFEPVFFQQPATLKGTPPGNGGVPASGNNAGIGSLDDGAYFRRVRLKADGVGYETVEFNHEINFEQLNYITFDHMWVGMKDLPFLGTVRVGQHKVPVGMENMGSDYHLTLLERSSPADAFSILFAPGIWFSNNYCDQNVVVQQMFHKTQPLGFYTSAFGDGNYASSTRGTWTPYYKDEGRHLIHVGGSFQWRTGNLGRELQPGGTGSPFGDSQDVIRLRARADLRDGIGIGSTGNLGGNVARYVDTGFLLAKSAQTFVPEFLTIWGPFSVQAEGYVVQLNDARSLYGPSRIGTPYGNPTFWGGYMETSYFLTGEHRGYDRRNGMYDRPVLNKNAFMVRGEDGRIHRNWGAWQVAYRYSYLDLDANGINGGSLNQHTMSLNWYINNATKIQFQYNISQREVVLPAASGTVHGYGMMAQWYF